MGSTSIRCAIGVRGTRNNGLAFGMRVPRKVLIKHVRFIFRSLANRLWIKRRPILVLLVIAHRLAKLPYWAGALLKRAIREARGTSIGVCNEVQERMQLVTKKTAKLAVLVGALAAVSQAADAAEDQNAGA
jgi:hypothetical protein